MLWDELMRYERGWDPWRELKHVQEEMDRIVSGLKESSASEFPAVNVWTGEDDMIVRCEVPGVDPSKLDISVIGETLTLRGERPRETQHESHRIQRRERGYGHFTRTLRLPFQINSEAVDAKYEKGVLWITLPRAEEEKPKRIAVQAA